MLRNAKYHVEQACGKKAGVHIGGFFMREIRRTRRFFNPLMINDEN